MEGKKFETEEVWDVLRQEWRPADDPAQAEPVNYTMGIIDTPTSEPFFLGSAAEPQQPPVLPATLMGLSDPNVPQMPVLPVLGKPAPEEPTWVGGRPNAGEADFVRVDRYTGPALMGVAGELTGRTIAIRGIMTLGRDPACDIILAVGAVGVSRKHLRFWMDGIRIHAMDLASTNGTTLNDVQMKPGLVYTLSQGDVLRFGAEEALKVV